MFSNSYLKLNANENVRSNQDGIIQAVFEIGNHFWAHQNWRPNFDELSSQKNPESLKNLKHVNTHDAYFKVNI